MDCWFLCEQYHWEIDKNKMDGIEQNTLWQKRGVLIFDSRHSKSWKYKYFEINSDILYSSTSFKTQVNLPDKKIKHQWHVDCKWKQFLKSSSCCQCVNFTCKQENVRCRHEPFARLFCQLGHRSSKHGVGVVFSRSEFFVTAGGSPRGFSRWYPPPPTADTEASALAKINWTSSPPRVKKWKWPFLVQEAKS